MKNDTSGPVWQMVKNFGAILAGLLLILLVLAALRYANTGDPAMLVAIAMIFGAAIVLWAFTSLLRRFF